MFINEGYKKSTENPYLISELYKEYKEFCFEGGFVSVSIRNFKKRLESQNIEIKRTAKGNSVYVESNIECPF